ncbi:MAG: hypothetical protein ACI9EQ_001074 [Bacteroidia bacterium]|jgi:hypothetical protein
MSLYHRLLFTFLLTFCAFSGMAQVSFDSQEELEKAADTFFNEGAYSKAKPLFSQLLSKEALNPNFNYRFGVCIMYTEPDPLKPLPYIQGGASSNGVNKEAYYFLGKAYQYNYRFEDAHVAFQKAKDAGYSKAGIDLDRNIEESLNGKVLFNPAIDFNPAQNKVVLESEFYRPYDFRKLKGKVIPMPPSFKTKYDQKNLVGTVVYTPSNSNVLVYASYGENGANAKDLYKVIRLPDGEWSFPQRLSDNINTKYDEDYAFYGEDSNTLLFASKGHNSMGGYDVFSAKFNPDKNSWSTPSNLQYPINSPFDDFLYISDPNGKVAFFTTARNSAEGKLRVMKTLLYDPDQVELSVVEGTFIDETDSIYNYASLTVLDPMTNQVIGKYRTNQETGKYVIILPPQNDYIIDVGPREASGFNFDLDVPKSDSSKPLQQTITYGASSEKGTVTVTNYFDATGKPDSLVLAESKPLNEVLDKMVAMSDPSDILAAREETAGELQISDARQNAQTNREAELAKKAELDAAKKLVDEKAIADKEVTAALAKSKAEKEEKDRIATAAAEQKLEEQKAAAELAAQQLEEGKLLAEMKVAEALAKAEKEEQERLLAETKKLEEEKVAKLAVQRKEDARLLTEMKATEAIALAKTQEEEKERLAAIEAKRLEEEEKEAQVVAQKAQEEKLLAELNAAEAIAFAKAEKEEKERIADTKAKQLENQKAAELAAQKLQEEKLLALAAESEAEKTKELAEKHRNDSVVDLLLALEIEAEAAALEIAIVTEEKVNLNREKQEKEQRLSIVEAEKALETQRKQEELERLLAVKEAARKDSLAQAELALLEESKKQKIIKDSVLQVAQRLAIAENERLEDIRREVELAKQQALKDSAEHLTIAQNEITPKEDKSFDDLLKEMAEKEAELLKEQEIAATSQSKNSVQTSDVETEEAVENLAEAELAQDNSPKIIEELNVEKDLKPSVKNTTVIETEEVQVSSEADLFLETIAKMEAQKAEQQRLIDEENAKLALERKENQKQEYTAKAEALAAAGDLGQLSENKPVDSTGAVLISGEKVVQVEEEIAVLKSHASPQDYLSALSIIEEQIAEDAAARPDKDYALKPLQKKPDSGVDAVLQKRIESDRLALEEHQIVAREKEKALKEEMQRNKGFLEGADQALVNEIAAIENEVVQLQGELESDSKSGTKLDLEKPVPITEREAEVNSVLDAEIAAVYEMEEEIESSLDQVEREEVTETQVEVAEEEKAEVRTTIVQDVVTQADEEVEEMLAETTEETVAEPALEEVVIEEVEKADSQTSQEQDLVIQADEEIEALLSETTQEEPNPSSVIEIEVEVVEQEIEVASAETKTEAALEVTADVIEESAEAAENGISELESELVDVAKPAERVITVGTIPFLEAAIRNPERAKPSFDAIEDKSQRRMIKRMRAEDVGRIAVLKNIKNEKIDAKGDAKSVEAIQQNLRNQDVVANASLNKREEYVRPRFDKNNLRQRQDVFYKLKFNITPKTVSETISEAMAPEQAMTFAMPEFDMTSDLYFTFADANSGYREYIDRGFDALKLVPYFKGAPTTLSVVEEIPFID